MARSGQMWLLPRVYGHRPLVSQWRTAPDYSGQGGLLHGNLLHHSGATANDITCNRTHTDSASWSIVTGVAQAGGRMRMVQRGCAQPTRTCASLHRCAQWAARLEKENL